jgi:hypothetical protein
MATRMANGFDVPGWYLTPLRWPTPQRGEVAVRNADGAAVTLAFALGADNGRSQVDLGVDVSEGCEERDARPLVEHVTSLLR